ncbi:CheY-like chemotaxis protein [Pseudoxanthomonas japonensis]|uniref:response regulator n=1 Tax=Pseudoxanthomonas TaxID=83618 RepID=UPI000784FB56|nr:MULTISPECIES: response regulator [Pseudoxanthomonas]MBA3929964.1 response regulator [Xanthomonas sp.]MBL8257539.1 response regulator [Pseudoxanthomonas mexicana]MDR7069143.1 CheY-like chemotaxis protein [Pseudoxanthomonas japonensis]
MTEPSTAKRVFIVEDESMLVMLLEDLLPAIGYDVVGTAGSVDDALAQLKETDVDLAVVDVNLAGTESFPVADALRVRGVPFLFTTGYGQDGLPPQYAGTPVLAKPFRRLDLEAALSRLQPPG